MSDKFWCSRNEIIAALKAEGFYYKNKYWQQPRPGRATLEADVTHIHTFLKNCCPSREDLPRVLLDDERGEFGFGLFAWHRGAKPVLCRLL